MDGNDRRDRSRNWISALDDDYGNTHDLAALAAIVRQHPGEDNTPAGERLTWLTRYAGAQVVMEDRSELLEAVTGTVTAIIDRIHMLTATEE